MSESSGDFELILGAEYLIPSLECLQKCIPFHLCDKANEITALVAETQSTAVGEELTEAQSIRAQHLYINCRQAREYIQLAVQIQS